MEDAGDGSCEPGSASCRRRDAVSEDKAPDTK